jgi:hypothetical protein
MNKYNDQQFDRALQGALHDVEVPAGMQDRLLAALEAGRKPIEDQVSRDLPLAARNQAWRRALRVLWSRRTLTLASCAAALLLAVGLGIHAWIQSRHIIEREQIASALGGWQKALTKNRPENGLPSDFVLPPLAVKPVKYVPFKTDEGWSAVAVDCTPPSGRPATLFIVRASARFRVPAAPYTRLSATTGKSVAAWQSGRLLYVLVVEESNSQRLEDFVRRPSFLRSHKRRSAVRST